MAKIPQISGIVARQVGAIQGKVTAQVQGRVLAILSKFTNQCPTSKEMQIIISQRNNLLKVINSFESRLNRLKGTANKFDRVISTLKTAIRIIKNIPLPTAIIPPMSGGLGIPIKILTTYSDALIRLNKYLDVLEADKEGVIAIINSTSNTLANLKQRLTSVDLAIQECSKQSPNLASIVADAQPKENTGSEGTPDSNYEYKGYKLEIIQDPNSPKIAPRRFAIAKDRRGIVVLKGQPSFSSSTDVLLEEIKFRIDNQLS
jgi:hypothetical protein